ncbi:MAG TPA: SGNH/GDSL hydrolase family protein [Gemmatimonadaceae bacterium]|nr:SGNH/GDSL hydrolase family protein [Gemmatimonadaceae bacterium]
MSKRILARAAAVLVLAGAAAGCHDSDAIVLGPKATGANAIFQSYVSIGNSIAAGYQSDGINDNTQRQSFPSLLAQQMRTRFAYPSLALPGCPPPITNFQTGARLGGASAPPCALRNAASATDILNNVAVPGAETFDATMPVGPKANVLTQLVLGGKTQAQRAIEARPTFVSIELGPNNALGAALSGLLTPTPGVTTGLTPETSFESSYAALTTQLTDALPTLQGVIVNVPDVTAIPALVPGPVFANPAAGAALNAATGKTVTVLPNCATSASLISLNIITAIKSGQHPTTISCDKAPDPNYPLLGDIFVLDATEQAAVSGAVAGYNTFLKAKADSLGFAYYDLKSALSALRGTADVKAIVDFTSATNPCGLALSLDCVHPTAHGNALIANGIIAAINAKYQTTLALVAVP